jgi:hypothetical protein
MEGFLGSFEHAVRELGENWRHPNWWRDRIEDRINTPVQQYVRPRSKALNVLDADWDTLIVLDACRADLFDQQVDTSSFDEV